MEIFADILTNASWGDVGFATLLSLAIWSIITGRLVPRSTVDDIRADRDSQLASKEAEKQEWREAYLLTDAALGELVAQNQKLLESAETSNHLLKAIKARADEATTT